MGVCSPKNYYYADKTVPRVINVMQFVFIVVAVVLSAVLIFRGALKRKVATDGGARSSPPFFRTAQQHANSTQIYTEQRDVRSMMTRLMRRHRPI
jgi:hypothetical protein